MRILIVGRYKAKLEGHVAPFVAEQGKAIAQILRKSPINDERLVMSDEPSAVEYFLVKGNYVKAVKALKAKIREFRPDVIHSHYGLSGLVANMATRRVPVICTYHGSDINLAKVRPLSKITMRLSAWNIFVSRRNMQLVETEEGKKCSLIPCGINMPLPWEKLRDQLVEQLTLNQWVEGVLEKGKKHVLFAGAFDNAVKDPDLAKASVALLDSVQLIELKGYSRNQVNALMYTCDAFLMTSKTEGSPQVIKEAMACGCPIVSVDVGDVAERVQGIEGCYIVATREPREIAATVEKALRFKGRTKGRERLLADGLSNEQVANRIIEIYERVIGGKCKE